MVKFVKLLIVSIDKYSICSENNSFKRYLKNQIVIIYKINISIRIALGLSDQMKEKSLKELEIMAKTKSHYVVHYNHSWIENNEILYIQMELCLNIRVFCSNMDLSDHDQILHTGVFEGEEFNEKSLICRKLTVLVIFEIFNEFL